MLYTINKGGIPWGVSWRKLTYTEINGLKHCESLGIKLRTNFGVRFLNMTEK